MNYKQEIDDAIEQAVFAARIEGQQQMAKELMRAITSQPRYMDLDLDNAAGNEIDHATVDHALRAFTSADINYEQRSELNCNHLACSMANAITDFFEHWQEKTAPVAPVDYRKMLKDFGWVEENMGGGFMVWFKDFMCTDGIRRMVGVDGENMDNPGGGLYPIDRAEYDRTTCDMEWTSEETDKNEQLHQFQIDEIATASLWVSSMYD